MQSKRLAVARAALLILTVSLSMLCLAGCRQEEAQQAAVQQTAALSAAPLPASMKGYELSGGDPLGSSRAGYAWPGCATLRPCPDSGARSLEHGDELLRGDHQEATERFENQ